MLLMLRLLINTGQIQSARQRTKTGRWMGSTEILRHQFAGSSSRSSLFSSRQQRRSATLSRLAYPEVQMAHVRQPIAMVAARVKNGGCRCRYRFSRGRRRRAFRNVVILLWSFLPHPLGCRRLAKQQIGGRRFRRRRQPRFRRS